MSLKENSLASQYTKPDESSPNEGGNNNLLNLLRSYEEELQQDIMKNSSGSIQEANSSELEKDLINDAEINSQLPIDELQSGFLNNLNKIMNSPNSKDELKKYSKPNKLVKHLSEDASPMDEETDMSDIISTSLSDVNSENKNNFSIISGISSKQVDDSRSNLSYLNYPINEQQSSNFSMLKNDDQISHISGSQMTNNFLNKMTCLEVIPEDDEEFENEEAGIPLGMTRGSKASTDLSSLMKNNSSEPISLFESKKSGENNSGEFVQNPSLLNVTIEEEFEKSNQEKSLNSMKNASEKYEKIAKEVSKNYDKDKKSILQSASQQNLNKEFMTQNSDSNIQEQNIIKSNPEFNSNINNLIEDNYGYEYEYSENANENENSDLNSSNKSSNNKSNISLNEIASSQKSNFTVEDLIKSNKNSSKMENKSQNSKHSEETIKKDQKNEESEIDGNDILSSFIESQHSKAKSDKLTNLDEFINSEASIQANNADNIESIISNIEERNSSEKNISSGFDSSRFNDILNDKEEEEEEEENEEDEASFEQVTYEVITDNIDNKEVEYSDNQTKSDKGNKIESFSENNSQKNSGDDKKSADKNNDVDLSLGNSILSDFTEGNSNSDHNKSDKASARSSVSNRSISNSDNKQKSADESDDFINSLTSDFIEAAAAEAEAEREKKKEKSSTDFESDFVKDEKESSKISVESKTESKMSDVQISVDFIDESGKGEKSSEQKVESSIALSSDFADESKSDASSVAADNQSISISFVEKSDHSSSYSSKKRKKRRKKVSKKSDSSSEIKADSIASEFISEDKKSSSSKDSSSENNVETFDNSSEFIDVESVKSTSKIESHDDKSEKSTTVENESDFIDSLSSKSKTKSSSSSSSSSNKSSKAFESDSINVESIHSLASESKSSSNSNKVSEESSINGESIHSLSEKSSSNNYSESIKASESDSINVESIHSVASSSSKSKSYSRSEISKKSQTDSINIESIHSTLSSSSKSSSSKSRSSSNKVLETGSIDGESIHSLSSSQSKSSSSKSHSESSKESESDSINVESIHSTNSSSSSSKSKSYSRTSKSKTSDFIDIESIHSSSSKSKSRSKMSKTSGFIESIHSSSSASTSYSKSTTKSQSDFISTLPSDSKSKSGKSSQNIEDDDFITNDSKSKAIESSEKSSKSGSNANMKSFFEFSDQMTPKEEEEDTKSLPKLNAISSPKQGQTSKSKVVSVNSQIKTKKISKKKDNKNDDDDDDEKPIKLSEIKSKSKFSTVSILDEIDSETSMSHLTISANSSEKTSGEFIGTIDVIGDKSIVSNISTESSKSSEKAAINSDDSLKKEKIPQIPKVLLKKSKIEKIDSPRRKKKNKSDKDEIENDFVDYNSKSDDENGRISKFKKLEISKAYDYPSKFDEDLDSNLNKTDITDDFIEEENENEEVKVVNMTESIIKKPRKDSSKRVVIDLKSSNKNKVDDKSNIKTPNRIEKLSMSPMFRNDIMPSKENISLTNITNISNNESRAKRNHIHKHRHHRQNRTEIPKNVEKVQIEDNQREIKTPQPMHRVMKFYTPTPITNNNTSINTSIRMSNIPSAAEMVDQNYVNTLKSAKLSLQYIKESINASRQMRYTRMSAMDPFQYTMNS